MKNHPRPELNYMNTVDKLILYRLSICFTSKFLFAYEATFIFI